MSTDYYAGDLYLICKAKHRRRPLTFRVTTRTPTLAADEVAIMVSVKLPSALFTRPSLRANVSVPETSVAGPTIDSTVVDNIREVLRQQLGADITLAVVEPTKEISE